MKVINDIHSFCSPETIYAKRGEFVSLVAKYGSVLIVQGPDGNKFPINTTQVSVIDKVAPSEAASPKTKINWLPALEKKTEVIITKKTKADGNKKEKRSS